MAHMNTLCRILKGVRTEWFGSPKRTEDKHCDATNHTAKLRKPTCHHCKKPGHYRNQCRQLKRKEDQARNNTNSADNSNNNISGKTNSYSNNKIYNNTNANYTNNQTNGRPRPFYPPCSTCGKTNHSTENCNLRNKCNEQTASPEQTTGRTIKSNSVMPKATQMAMSELQSKL